MLLLVVVMLEAMLKVRMFLALRLIYFFYARFRKLDRKDFFGSSDPFLQFSRSTEHGGFVVVHRTEVIKNNLNPSWKRFSVPVLTLCNGDEDRNLKVECFDHNVNGSHSLIGEFYVTVRQLKAGPGERTVFDVISPKKKAVGPTKK